jgi:hypothetical protein
LSLRNPVSSNDRIFEDFGVLKSELRRLVPDVVPLALIEGRHGGGRAEQGKHVFLGVLSGLYCVDRFGIGHVTSNLNGRIASRQGQARRGQENSSHGEAPASTLSPWARSLSSL